MDNPLTILVTGAASGIGAGIAELLAESGHRMLLADLDLEAAQQVASAIHANGGQAAAIPMDVSNEDSIAAVRAQLVNVDVLINNAGLQHVARLEDFPMEKWDTLVQVMLTGTARLTRAVIPGMRQRNFGRIINIGSVHSLVASPYKSAYVAAKHGLLGFAKVIALETADVDITINTVCPAYVKTPLVEKQIKAQAREHQLSEHEVVEQIMLKPMPKGVFIEYDELEGIASFLISHPARNITGQTIVVDGGWTIQ